MSSVTPTLPPTPSTIANLPLATTPLAGNEYVPISQNGVTKRVASNGFSVVGPTGPAGPTGATGATGPQGPAGGAANINSGTINQLAYYAATGNTLSGLPTGNNGILATSAGGVPSITTTIPNGVTATTQTAGDSSTKLATTGFVNGTALTLANGSIATTQSANDNSTKVATTAYVDAKPSGARVLLSTQTASNSAMIDFTSGIDGTYPHYIIEASNFTTVSDNVNLYLRIQSGGVFLTDSHYNTAAAIFNANTSATNNAGSAAQAQAVLNGPVGTSSSIPQSLIINFFQPQLAAQFFLMYDYIGSVVSTLFRISGSITHTTNTAAVTGVRIYPSTGNIATGTFQLFGVT